MKIAASYRFAEGEAAPHGQQLFLFKCMGWALAHASPGELSHGCPTLLNHIQQESTAHHHTPCSILSHQSLSTHPMISEPVMHCRLPGCPLVVSYLISVPDITPLRHAPIAISSNTSIFFYTLLGRCLHCFIGD